MHNAMAMMVVRYLMQNTKRVGLEIVNCQFGWTSSLESPNQMALDPSKLFVCVCADHSDPKTDLDFCTHYQSQ